MGVVYHSGVDDCSTFDIQLVFFVIILLPQNATRDVSPDVTNDESKI